MRHHHLHACNAILLIVVDLPCKLETLCIILLAVVDQPWVEAIQI